MQKSVDRFFKAYVRYTSGISDDSLFELLTALHSLDDRLSKTHGRLFFEIPEYVVLKAVRNHFHHSTEISNTSRRFAFGAPFTSDLLTVCLISKKDCTDAIAGTEIKFREKTRQAFEHAVFYYGDIANINPCIFNACVKIYEVLGRIGLTGKSLEFHLMKSQYDWETVNGQSHYVDGGIKTHAESVLGVCTMLSVLYASSV